MAKHTTIWKSYGMYSLKEMEQEEKACKEFLSEVYPEIEQTEENVIQKIYQDIDVSFDDSEIELNKQLDGRILAIASMGLWNGRKSGYKILGNNLNEVLTSSIGCDEKEVYCDAYNVYARGYHHDGRNNVEFREIREDRNIENLLDKIYSGKEVTRREINYYTRSLRPYVKQVYGI